jgi:hypothetical protein
MQRFNYSAGIYTPHKIVLAAYASDYDQKHELTIDDEVEAVEPEFLLKFGIRCAKVVYLSKSYVRTYIVFIDDPSVLESAESFDNFATEYCEKYFPPGISPMYFALKFKISSFSVYERYYALIRERFRDIVTFYDFHDLLRKQYISEKIEAAQSNSVHGFKPVLYDSAVFAFKANSEFSPNTYVGEYVKGADLWGSTLGKNTCLIQYEGVQPLVNEVLAAMHIAYLSFRFGAQADLYSHLNTRYIEFLRKFYFWFSMYTGRDKVLALADYPVLAYSNKDLADFLVYLPTDKRIFSVSVEYIGDSGAIEVETLAVDKRMVLEYDEDEQFRLDTFDLERATTDKQFVHVGNSIYLDLHGKKRLAYISRFNLKFSGVVCPCDAQMVPFELPLSLPDVIDCLPWKTVRFAADGGGKALRERLVRVISQYDVGRGLASSDTEAAISGHTSLYTPAYARNGIGVIANTFSEVFHTTDVFDVLDPIIRDMYSPRNLLMRSGVVDRLAAAVPLRNMRGGGYLTPYGTQPILVLSDGMFKTVR